MSNRTPSPHCSCLVCRRELPSKGLTTHQERSHGSLEVRAKYPTGYHGDYTEHKKRVVQRQQAAIAEYLKSPNYCKQCGDILLYEKNKCIFCSSSCAATHNNNIRSGSGYTETELTKTKRLDSLRAYNASHPHIPRYSKLHRCRSCKQTYQTNKQAIDCSCGKAVRAKMRRITAAKAVIHSDGPYSKLKLCTCKHCKIQFVNRTQVQFCTNCRIKSSNKWAYYKFRFSIRSFPDLFDGKLINQIGWYKKVVAGETPDRSKLSRDHRVSVSEAIANNYDRYYIIHPLNCHIMTMAANGKKSGKSSMLYSELVHAVNVYDSENPTFKLQYVPMVMCDGTAPSEHNAPGLQSGPPL